jgi:protein-disulfide isomerase
MRMKHPLAARLRAVIATGFIAITAAFAIATPAQAFDEAQKAEIGKIVREYLLANPEVMVEVQQALEAKREQQKLSQQKKTLEEMRSVIQASTNGVAIGKQDAEVTVVEFFDYNCGFCARALTDMNTIIEGNDNVRFVLKEYPILSRDSLDAHKISLAVARLMPEKYAEFHSTLLGTEGHKDGEMALSLAVALGGDAQALKAEAEKPEVDAQIQETYRLAEGLGITGTPSYVIGEEVVFGAVGAEQLNKRIANLQNCGATTC